MPNEYIAIVTKIRGMEGKLLSKSSFVDMTYLNSSIEVVSFLKKQPEYRHLFEDIPKTKMYRSHLEALLNASIYESMNKLYHFANFKQREFLKIYGITYEVSVLKKFLRKAFDIDEIYEEISDEYLGHLKKHSNLDFEALRAASSLNEYREVLKGSRYYKAIESLESLQSPRLFDYETALDTFAFQQIWKSKNQLLNKKEQKIFEKLYGTKFDLLNIMFIYRYKKFYNLPPEQIITLIIPIQHKLRENELTKLIHAKDLDEFWKIVNDTKYSKYMENIENGVELEILSDNLLKQIIEQQRKKDPYSVISLYSYLTKKEEEVDKLTTVIEAIHYDRRPDEIQEMIGVKEYKSREKGDNR
ncbi:V-type ATPase subunit [Lacticigenium naphthae]|uniref:V-type ATPase subunit n=1 Tax=Lacticigenium naphthae TaxID=515351 RepID=UPI0003FA9761|nr:V-type ATPase subunit [Lacticigenium naphthae]